MDPGFASGLHANNPCVLCPKEAQRELDKLDIPKSMTLAHHIDYTVLVGC